MPVNDSHGRQAQGRRVSRRTFVKAAGASGIAAGLAGCAGGDGGGGGGGGEDTPIDTAPPEEEVTIQFASDGNFKQAQDTIVGTMRENGGLPDTVNLDIIAGGFETGDRRAKYEQLLSAGEEKPTLLMMDNGWTIPFIARGRIQNLSKSLPGDIIETVRSDYFESMVATATGQNGDLYGVPLFADFPTIQYRKDLMRQAGYSDSDFGTWATDSMKWAKFSQVVKQVADETDKTGFNWQGASYEGLSCCDFVEFMSSWGGAYFGGFDNLFGPVGDRPVTVDEQSVVDAIRMLRTFIHGSGDDVALDGYANISPAAVVQYKEESSRKPFTEGNVVALRNWPYSININAAEDAFGTDLGVMPIPYEVTAEESKYGPEIGGIPAALGGWHVTLNPNSPAEKKRAAVQVFQALQSDQVRLDMFEAGGWIPPIPELVASDRAKQLEPIGRYVEQLKIAGENAVPRPVTVVWPQESTQIAKEVSAALRQEKTPQKAMSDLKKALNQIEQSA